MGKHVGDQGRCTVTHLPREWQGKRASVRLSRPESTPIEATIEDQNDGGFFIREREDDRQAFIPWSAISYVKLLEAPGEHESFMRRIE